MESFLQTMAWPFLACVVLTGIHVYLGLHVLERKVIFVDLALAQVAAFGAVWGVLLGWSYEGEPWAIKAFSLAFTFAGAALFALTRSRRERVPHEAIIGIAYAVTLAATILATAHLPHGAEEVGDLLAGSILWVRGDVVLETAALYAVIGVFHFAFRRRFLSISMNPEAAHAEGIRIGLWDFMFYVSFGFVVTSSVTIGGVLLVFSYLVIPSVIAALFADSVRGRLALGWTIGTVVSLVGVVISYERDLPSGPTIVVCFGAILALAGAVHVIRLADDFAGGVGRVGTAAIALLLLFGGSLFFHKDEHSDLEHQLSSPLVNERLMAIRRAQTEPMAWYLVRRRADELFDDVTEVRRATLELFARRGDASLLPTVAPLLRDEDDLVREEAVLCYRALGNAVSAVDLLHAAAREEDEFLQVEMAESALELGAAGGIGILLEVMDRSELEQARRDAYEHLRIHTELELSFDSSLPPGENDPQLAPIRDWWEAVQAVLAFDPETRTYSAPADR